MEAGKVSIVVPVFNVEKYLEHCINSILQQDYKNLELILVDDGSSDNSGVICDYYEDKDNRIKVLHTTNRGVSNARNSGINLISGEYVLFADSDDWLEKDMISHLVSAFEKNDCDLAMCDVYYVTVDENGKMEKADQKKWGEFSSETNIEDEGIYRAFFINSGTLWNKLIKTEIIEDIKFDIGQRYGEDLAYLLKLIPNIKRVTVIPYCGYNYFINRRGNVVSADVDERSLEFIRLGVQIYKEISASGMGAVGVYRIYAIVRQVINKIPANKRNDKKYNVYYTEARKALRLPNQKDKIRFLLDKKMGKRVRLEYCIKTIWPRSLWKIDAL